MKILMFLIDLPLRFLFALISFTFRGWIGWSGIVLVLLKVIGIINWPWWVAALPLEYGVLYCLHMTIDGALYRAGKKGVGGYARFTTTDKQLALGEMEQAIRNVKRQRERYSDEQLALAEMEQAVRDLERKKTSEEKERMMDSLKITRLDIFERVHQSLPEQLRNRDEINRAIAEQINYATASSQFEGDDEEMRRKLNALLDKLRRNGADEAANEIAKAVDMRPHYLALAESIMR